MALPREEVSNIAQEAAGKVMISKQCLEKAYHVYEAHEYAHAASSSALKLDQESADRYLNLMRHELEAADLPREDLEELGQDIVDAAHWIKEKNKEAVYPLGRFLDKTKELMFQVVVTCECGEAKAIEEKLGKEALQKILASTESNPSNPNSEKLAALREILSTKTVDEAIAVRGKYRHLALTPDELEVIDRHLNKLKGESNPGDYVTITDPGKTTFKVGEVVSREAI